MSSPFTFAKLHLCFVTHETWNMNHSDSSAGTKDSLLIKPVFICRTMIPQNATATKGLQHPSKQLWVYHEKKERSYESHHMWSLFLESVLSQTRKLATKYNYWLTKVVINSWNHRQLYDTANQYTQINRDKKISMTSSCRAQTSPGLSRCGCVKGLGWPKYRFGIFCWAGWMENLRRAHDLQTRGKEMHHVEVKKKPQNFSARKLQNCSLVIWPLAAFLHLYDKNIPP